MESQCATCSSAARVRCFCKESEQIFCVSCLEQHLATRGVRHIIKEISERKDPQCSTCKQSMELVCLCQGSKTRLCHNCLIPHMLLSPSQVHSIEPLLVDSLIEDPQDLSRYLEKKKTVDFLVSEARNNFQVLDKYREKVLAAKEAIIASLEKTV